MASLEALEKLPEIDILEEEGITITSLQQSMIADYEQKYFELTGEELTLYPADTRRILINTTAGKLYQLAAIINERHKLNFLQYMYGQFTKNWGANFGFTADGSEAAKVTLKFTLAAVQTRDITIPAGTRGTAGDRLFFATDEELVISAGSLTGEVIATCTEKGTCGNDYKTGQINIIADPIDMVDSVINTDDSSGGHDEYTNDELKELILNYTSTYSTAGPEDCYSELVKAYSSDISDAKVITNTAGVVSIYILRKKGIIPDETYRRNVLDYLIDLNNTPDTDKVLMLAPEVVEYNLDIDYYIPYSRKDIAEDVRDAIEDACSDFVTFTHTKIGRSINPDVLTSFANAAGAERLVIRSPQYKELAGSQIGICKSMTLHYKGLERE